MMSIFLRTEWSTVRAMCGVQLRSRKRNNDLMLMLGVNEAIKQSDQLAM